jgi:hypothetical protein
MQRLSVWLRWIAGWQLVGEFTEVESGKHSDRPQLAAALAACKKQRAKLVIAKLDRKNRYGPKFQHLWISLEGQSFLSPARRRAKPRWPRSRRAGGIIQKWREMMRRATMWSLACAAVSISLFWIHAVAAPADDIIFAPKAFFDFGDAAVEISGTLTGEDVPFKNNTVVVACYKDRRECLTYSIAQAGPNQMGRLGGPVIYPITTWNAYEVIATEDDSCQKTTITLQRKRQSAVWVEEPINVGRAACKNVTTNVYKWTIEDPPAFRKER